MQSYRSDALIIGGGLAGIAAALELIERGVRVLLVDRDREENFGGLARESFGGIFVVGSDEQRRAKIEDSPELALADWTGFGELTDADLWPKRWAESYVHRCRDDVYRWLKERGLSFVPLPLLVSVECAWLSSNVALPVLVSAAPAWLSSVAVAAKARRFVVSAVALMPTVEKLPAPPLPVVSAVQAEPFHTTAVSSSATQAMKPSSGW